MLPEDIGFVAEVATFTRKKRIPGRGAVYRATGLLQ